MILISFFILVYSLIFLVFDRFIIFGVMFRFLFFVEFLGERVSFFFFFYVGDKIINNIFVKF